MLHVDSSNVRCHFRGGFTIVEAIFVMSIIGILAAIALPRFAGFTATQQTEAATRRVLTDLSFAQRQARMTGSLQRVIFSVGSGTYQLPDMTDPDDKNQSYSIDLAEDPYRAVITAASFGGDSTVAFDGYGTPDTSGLVTITVGQYQQTIRVDGGLTRPRIDGAVIAEAID